MLASQDLTATALRHLIALDDSAYTSLAGSRSGLELMASVVHGSSLAGNDLANALSANPYEGAPFAWACRGEAEPVQDDFGLAS
ncbi:hypothetical protein ABZ848_27810 [Streptomyces sp. NPDC047081]|uniref:hypothetical protein n=1 Tax=Streptomyces sp. NPDC047081 TaxID=3154706 RepID=UPI0033DB439D